ATRPSWAGGCAAGRWRRWWGGIFACSVLAIALRPARRPDFAERLGGRFAWLTLALQERRREHPPQRRVIALEEAVEPEADRPRILAQPEGAKEPVPHAQDRREVRIRLPVPARMVHPVHPRR